MSIKTLQETKGMTSFEERTYLYEYAKNDYSGTGEIVDLGCWLGSSTISLAMGLEENSNIDSKEKRIHAYDLFVWTEGMKNAKAVVGTPVGEKYNPGDSFLDEYITRIQPWEHLIQVYPGDLTQIGWDNKKSIDYLFVDAMKTWDLANSIIQNFFPYLIPECSFVHHNDWKVFGNPRVHVLMHSLQEYLVPVAHANPAMIFKLVKPIPKEKLNISYKPTSFSDGEIDEAFNYSFDISPTVMHPGIAAAKVKIWVERKNIQKAEEDLNLYKDRYVDIQDANNHLNRVENLLVRVKKNINQQ